MTPLLKRVPKVNACLMVNMAATGRTVMCQLVLCRQPFCISILSVIPFWLGAHYYAWRKLPPNQQSAIRNQQCP